MLLFAMTIVFSSLSVVVSYLHIEDECFWFVIVTGEKKKKLKENEREKV